MYREFITESLEAASQLALEKFGNVSSSVKPEDNNQVLTEADEAIGHLLVGRVTNTYPDHNIIDEEAGIIDKGSRFTWVVDPIDGTSNFAAGSPNYGPMIGLLEDGTPIAGGAALPSLRKLYVAEEGLGTTCNGSPIHVSEELKLLNCLVAYGIDGHQEAPDRTREEAALLGELILQIRNLRSTNSVSDIMAVAEGTYGAFLNQTTRIWDNVAPQIIIEEAGGVYTDFWGKPIDYANPLAKANDNFSCCTAPQAIHKQLQDIIHR